MIEPACASGSRRGGQYCSPFARMILEPFPLGRIEGESRDQHRTSSLNAAHLIVIPRAYIRRVVDYRNRIQLMAQPFGSAHVSDQALDTGAKIGHRTDN